MDLEVLKGSLILKNSEKNLSLQERDRHTYIYKDIYIYILLVPKMMSLIYTVLVL